MKHSDKIFRTFMLFGAASALLALNPLRCSADDEISVEQIRRELRQAAGARAVQDEPTTIGKDFALSEKDVETENARLEAQEAELLKKLSSPEAQALVKDVAAGKLEAVPTAASLGGRSGREVAASAAAAAATARAESITSVESIPETEAAPIVRAVRKTEEPETAPKASLSAVSSASQSSKTLAKTVKTSSPDPKALKADADSRDAALKSLNAQIATLRRANTELSTKLQKSDLQVQEVSKQLETAKNRLMLAESEVERLAGSIEVRNRSAAMKFGGTATNAVAPAQSLGVVAPAVQRTQSKASDDTPVATVVAEKANLRTGPGADNSPLMSVTRGTRLVVETKQGDWYRVVSPTGTRAWVSSDVVAFGPNSQSSPTRTVRIKGYDGSLEGDNFNITKSDQ